MGETRMGRHMGNVELRQIAEHLTKLNEQIVLVDAAITPARPGDVFDVMQRFLRSTYSQLEDIAGALYRECGQIRGDLNERGGRSYGG